MNLDNFNLNLSILICKQNIKPERKHQYNMFREQNVFLYSKTNLLLQY